MPELEIRRLGRIGPENMKEFDEIYGSATRVIPSEIWRDFRLEFGVRA